LNYATISADESIISAPDGQSFTRQISASPTPGAANVLQALNQPPTISPITDVNVVVGQTISFAVSGQ